MNHYFPQANRFFARNGSIFLLLGHIGLAVAQPPSASAPANNGRTALVTNGGQGAEIQLEVRQMPLAKVLDSVAKQTKVPIHYSVLPEGVITATCVGSALKLVLECLLNRKADLIVRYPKKADKSASNSQILEAWVLGSKLEAAITPSGLCTATSETGSMRLSQQEAEIERDADQSGALLKLAKSQNADERTNAIGALLAIGRDGDPAIKAALEEALHDQDANVRSQAVSTFTHRGDIDKEEQLAAIREAMQDESTDVRMMAVDGIADDVALLQQAVNDEDEVIRTLAQEKLNILIANGAKQPEQ
ncbi:MAG: HEAT repeat domain-containing protein [Methyloglobulus sp.]|nr:hypothetical protein [Methyloglobulus sp.]